jgi:hypothetical protein
MYVNKVQSYLDIYRSELTRYILVRHYAEYVASLPAGVASDDYSAYYSLKGAIGYAKKQWKEETKERLMTIFTGVADYINGKIQLYAANESLNTARELFDAFFSIHKTNINNPAYYTKATLEGILLAFKQRADSSLHISAAEAAIIRIVLTRLKVIDIKYGKQSTKVMYGRYVYKQQLIPRAKVVFEGRRGENSIINNDPRVPKNKPIVVIPSSQRELTGGGKYTQKGGRSLNSTTVSSIRSTPLAIALNKHMLSLKLPKEALAFREKFLSALDSPPPRIALKDAWPILSIFTNTYAKYANKTGLVMLEPDMERQIARLRHWIRTGTTYIPSFGQVQVQKAPSPVTTNLMKPLALNLRPTAMKEEEKRLAELKRRIELKLKDTPRTTISTLLSLGATPNHIYAYLAEEGTPEELSSLTDAFYKYMRNKGNSGNVNALTQKIKEHFGRGGTLKQLIQSVQKNGSTAARSLPAIEAASVAVATGGGKRRKAAHRTRHRHRSSPPVASPLRSKRRHTTHKHIRKRRAA